MTHHYLVVFMSDFDKMGRNDGYWHLNTRAYATLIKKLRKRRNIIVKKCCHQLGFMIQSDDKLTQNIT